MALTFKWVLNVKKNRGGRSCEGQKPFSRYELLCPLLGAQKGVSKRLLLGGGEGVLVCKSPDPTKKPEAFSNPKLTIQKRQ